jgi:hypothetical protein
LVKTDSSGNAIWNQTYGGTNIEIAECMVQTSDGGYALTGYTYPTEHSDLADFWLVKTDANGTEQWNQTYGGAKGDAAWSLIQTSDGGYALTGDTMSFGDWRGDAWLVKTDAVGNVQWDQIYGTNYETDSTHWVVQTSDGGYALAGYADGFGWFFKIDGSGNVQWSHAYGGWQSFIRAGVQTSDGGYALAGDTSFYSSYAYYDFWLVKTDSSGNWQWEGAYGGPNTYGRDSHYAYSIVQTSDGGYTLAGCTYYFGAGGSDAWLIKTSAESYNLTITTTTGGITNPPPETYSYSAATMANVTAAPNTGYYFDHWELDGVDVGSTNPITITMNTNHTLEAMFSSIQYTLIITATTEGTTDPAPGTYTYSYGAIVSVQALPNTGYELDHWELNGTSIGSANPVTITMDANHTLHAIFTYSVTILAHCNTEGVDVSVSISFDGSPTGYTTPHTFTNLSSTHTFTVTTTDLSGHEFSQWSTGNTSTTTSVSSGGTYTAYYYQQSSSVGGFVIPVDKLGLLAPYIGLASTLIVATVATAVYVNRVKPKKKKQ